MLKNTLSISLVFILALATDSHATINCSPGGTLSGSYSCYDNLTTQNPSTIESSANVTFLAGQSITLSPGFWVKTNSTFDAKISNDVVSDGLLDSWEMQYFGNLSQGATGDPDSDGLNNLGEYLAYTNPTNADTDNDGMPDGWEVSHGLNPLVNDASGDLDNDGFTNYQEYLMGTLPNDPSDPGAPLDIDLGIDADEQQGGGGLVGETIRIFNGNVIESRSDLNFSSPNRLGLTFAAFYNSKSATSGALGYGLSHTYSAVLNPSIVVGGLQFLKITDGTGKAHYFTQEYAGSYKGEYAEKTKVTIESGEYVWHLLDGSRYGFGSTGRLSWIDDSTGNRLNLAYDGNSRLQTVTDNASGRILTFHYNASNLIYEIIGPTSSAVTDGVWVSYGYTNNNLTSVTYADGSGFAYQFTDSNDVHNLTGKKDKVNHQIDTWGYDSSDRAISNFSKDGKGADIVYVSPTQINVADAYGKQREYLLTEAAGRKRVSAITDGPDGAGGFPYSDSNIVSWVYDDRMRPTEMSTERDITTEYSDFDARGNPGTVTLASGTADERVIDYTWHPFINTPLTRTEPSVIGTWNKVTIWDYDNDYNTTSNENPTTLVSRVIERGYTKNASGSIVSYEYITTYHYNSKGQVISIDGPLAGAADTTTFTYNTTTGDLLTIVRPLIGTTTFAAYDTAGQAGNITDVNSKTKTYTYDGRGRMTAITNNADSSTSSVAYNTAGVPDSKTDEDSVTTTFSYESTYGRLLRRTDSQGNYISYSYDDQGNVIGKDYYDSSDVLSNSKSYLYTGSNLPGLLYREINGDNTYTQYNYDLDGNVSSVRDPNGNTTSYAYDFQNRLKTVTQPGTIITQYDYDGHGNLQSVIDANNHTTTYQYDDMARLVLTTSPDTGTTTYVYDAAGNPINKKDAKAVSITYTYDVLNRLTNVDFPSDTDITYSYDSGTNGMGQRTGMADQSGSYTFGYDARGRLAAKTSVINGMNYTLSRVYTPGSRISSMTYPSGRTVNYYRTVCACKVDSITTAKDGVTTSLMNGITYRPFGSIYALNNGAGGTVGSTYNSAGRLTVSNPGAAHERSYTYDNNGNTKTINATLIDDQDIYDRSYDYDALNRLTNSEGPWGGIDYSYDNVGNRLTEATGSGTNTYSYVTGTNLLTSVAGASTTSYAYDSNGNITGIGTKTLNYNQDNRLISVVQGATTLGAYTYNGLGQRVKKVAGTSTTIFHYDFDGNIIGESDLSGTFSKEYLYRGSSRLAMVDVGASKVYYYGNDGLGTPEIVTDSDNTIRWEAVYTPFGQAEVKSYSTVSNNFRFPGQYYDSETGLHYNYNRYYDPSTGRYLTPDPIGQDGGLNLFAYTLNNPVNGTDPLGLASWSSYWDAGFMFADWLLGTGPTNRVYDSESELTKNMMNAPGVKKARESFYQKNTSTCEEGYQPLTNYNPRFGLTGLVRAGLNPTQQYVGNYRIDITPNTNNTLTFNLTNTTSMTSFLYGGGPAWDRKSFSPGGNMTQTYTWTEAVR